MAIAFALAWLPFSPMLAGREPVETPLMAFAPAIAAVVVRRWVTREGFHDAGLRPNLRHWPSYLLAATWPVATTLLSVLLAALSRLGPAATAVPWGAARPDPATLVGWVLLSVAITPLLMGEELGWRGYLQVRLLAGQPFRAAVATGLIWGVWHYPMILAGDQRTASVAWMLVLMPVVGVVLSLFLGWLRQRTGDVWAGSLAHAANNATEDRWHRLAFTGRADGVAPLWSDLLLVLSEAVVLVGVVALHTRRIPHRPAAPWHPDHPTTEPDDVRARTTRGTLVP